MFVDREPSKAAADSARASASAVPANARASSGFGFEKMVPKRVRNGFTLLLPWASLLFGVAGAFWMDRSPKRAWIVAVATIATWLMVLLLAWLSRLDATGMPRTRKLLLRVAQLSSLLATQSLLQLTLFFALPFYFYAAALDVGHIVFVATLTLLSIASLWDPWTERVLQRPLLAAALPAVGSFAALAAVLPALGLSTYASLWIAVASASIGWPVLTAATASHERRARSTATAALVALAFPVIMYFGGARIVPAAPLRLVRADIGTALQDHWVVDPSKSIDHAPARLVCATAIASPLGLRDRLFHVWRKDGKPRARIELKIVGGRTQGFRTNSRIQVGHPARGRYSCTVETASGQVLGSRSVKVRGD